MAEMLEQQKQTTVNSKSTEELLRLDPGVGGMAYSNTERTDRKGETITKNSSKQTMERISNYGK